MRCILISLVLFGTLAFGQTTKVEQHFSIENGQMTGWRIEQEFDREGVLLRSDSTRLDESNMNTLNADGFRVYGNQFGPNEFKFHMDFLSDSLWQSFSFHDDLNIDSLFNFHMNNLKNQIDEDVVPEIIIPENQKNKTKKI